VSEVQYRLVKRDNINLYTGIGVRTMSILLSLIAIGFFMMLIRANPLEVFGGIIKGSFGSSYRIKSTIIRAIPILISALGISVDFKMKYWNIGGEGQIFMGAFGASFIAYKFPDLPMVFILALMLLSSIIIGGLYALISGMLKVYFNSNETIVTLMLNYIALKLIIYLQFGPWRDKRAMGFPKMPNFLENAILPEVLGIHAGWIIALVMIAVVYVFMNHTKKGYEISVIGESENTARYAGIGIKKTTLLAVFISGALCGLAGFVQASAVSQTLSTEVTGGVGYTAIIVAWLSNLSSPIILVVSILFAALIEGSNFIQTSLGIPSAVASILQSLILFFILGSEIFIKYKVRRAS
jgi:general nucleoside transport system permease protein